MNLSGYVQHLRDQLSVAAEAGGDDTREVAIRLTAALDSATRLTLLEALSAAAEEITTELAPGGVELRLRAGEPEFVVTPAPIEEDYREITVTSARTDLEDDDASMARLNLRLPENLKQRVEDAARREGLSLNAWLIRAAHAALQTPSGSPRRASTGGDRFTGWVR